MFKPFKAIPVYPNQPAATNLALASGGVRLLSWLVLIAAIGSTLLALIPAVQVLSMAGLPHGMYYILDELDEVMLLAFALWCVFAVLRYAAAVMRIKADQLTTDLTV